VFSSLLPGSANPRLGDPRFSLWPMDKPQTPKPAPGAVRDALLISWPERASRASAGTASRTATGRAPG
jgi:hypothetical protein